MMEIIFSAKGASAATKLNFRNNSKTVEDRQNVSTDYPQEVKENYQTKSFSPPEGVIVAAKPIFRD